MASKSKLSVLKLPLRAATGFKENDLTRRRHQGGQLLELEHGWATRLYEDYIAENGERKRRRVQKFLGSFEKLPTKRSAQNAMLEELAVVNCNTARPRSTQTFREVAAVWIADCEKRKRKPVKPSVIAGWKSILRNHVNPLLGETSLSDIRNRAAQSLVKRLVAKKLSPATIKNVLLTVKLAVASAVDDDGNQLFPIKWNRAFIDAPVIDPTKQHRPVFNRTEIERIVQASSGRLQMACVLFAASGIRAGELLGLECRHFDGAAIHVEQELWHGMVLPPKTENARRIVDLHPDVAALLTEFLGGRKAGFIFQTGTGRPINQRNLARGLYKALAKLELDQRGFHAFRRFRNTHLRQLHCPDGLLKFWMGHSSQDMSDHYDRSCEDVQFRRDAARSLAVGFELPKGLTPKQVQRPKVAEEVISGVNGRRAETVITC